MRAGRVGFRVCDRPSKPCKRKLKSKRLVGLCVFVVLAAATAALRLAGLDTLIAFVSVLNFKVWNGARPR